MNDATITSSEIGAQQYNGASITPAVTIMNGTTALVSGTDYTVAYSNIKIMKQGQ